MVRAPSIQLKLLYSKMQALIPPLCLLLSALVFGTILHSNTQVQRTCLTPLFLLSAYHSLAGPDQFHFSFSLMSLWNLAVGLYVLHTISLFHIERWPAPKRQLGLSRRQVWMRMAMETYRLWGNPRLILPNKNQDARTTTTTTREFAALRLLKLALYSITYTTILPTITSHILGQITPSDVDSAQRTLVRPLCRALFLGRESFSSTPQLSPQALLLRAHTSLSWILESVILLDGANAALGLFSVCILRADDAQDWPPLFGSLAEATSVARFWSRFWHRLAARPYVNIGRVLAGRVLRLDAERGFVGRLAVAAVVFALSGWNHALVTWQGGVRDWEREVWWFMGNFCACVGEKVVGACFGSVVARFGCLRSLDRAELGWVKRAIGRTWLFAFFCWSVPKWQYPRMEKQAVALEDVERLRRILSRT